jgi:hypothetical protein
MRTTTRLACGAILACGALAGCTTGDVYVPSDPILRQVPTSGAYSGAVSPSASSSGGADFAATIESALAAETRIVDPGLPPGASGTPLDADTLNLTLYTIEQQKIDARIAQEELERARSQLVIVEPQAVPRTVQGVNIALYAQQTTNAVGEPLYGRSVVGRVRSGCARYASADEAQRAFLAGGGPTRDPLRLDPDGDGFACGWDPRPYRQLRL